MFRLLFCVLIALLLPACDQGGPEKSPAVVGVALRVQMNWTHRPGGQNGNSGQAKAPTQFGCRRVHDERTKVRASTLHISLFQSQDAHLLHHRATEVFIQAVDDVLLAVLEFFF